LFEKGRHCERKEFVLDRKTFLKKDIDKKKEFEKERKQKLEKGEDIEKRI